MVEVMRKVRAGAAVVLAMLGVANVSATSIEPPEFAQVVERADKVLVVRVEAIGMFKTVGHGQEGIETRVALRVLETWAGAAPEEEILKLRLLGGQVGDRVLRVAGMPQFKEGEEMVLFVRGNEREICPLVGWGHGQYRIKVDPATGRRYVERANGVPLTALHEVAEPLANGALMARFRVPAQGLSVAEFRAAVRDLRPAEPVEKAAR